MYSEAQNQNQTKPKQIGQQKKTRVVVRGAENSMIVLLLHKQSSIKI